MSREYWHAKVFRACPYISCFENPKLFLIALFLFDNYPDALSANLDIYIETKQR